MNKKWPEWGSFSLCSSGTRNQFVNGKLSWLRSYHWFCQHILQPKWWMIHINDIIWILQLGPTDPTIRYIVRGSINRGSKIFKQKRKKTNLELLPIQVGTITTLLWINKCSLSLYMSLYFNLRKHHQIKWINQKIVGYFNSMQSRGMWTILKN